MEKISHWYQSFLKSIQLQLFISCISLPFLIAWGLPISVLAPISTLLFGPFLTGFLFISSLIFFSELFYLPNGFFIWLLENLTVAWLCCLNLQQPSWLIGLAKPSLIGLFLIPLSALFVIHNKKITHLYSRIFFLTGILIGSCLIIKALSLFHHSKSYKIEKIACNTGKISLISSYKSIGLIDPGYLACRPSFESFISYSLIPEIIKKQGVLHLDYLIIGTFNKRILDALYFLTSKITIKKIYLPAWKGKIPFFAWKSYKQLKKGLQETGATLIPVSAKKIINLDTKSFLSLEPLSKKTISYYDATYQKLSIHAILNNQSFTF